MYSDLLLQIKIPLPGDVPTYSQCGIAAEDYEEPTME